jgi:hypothetical protein
LELQGNKNVESPIVSPDLCCDDLLFVIVTFCDVREANITMITVYSVGFVVSIAVVMNLTIFLGYSTVRRLQHAYSISFVKALG